ncbi:MAG: hypothetical protein IJ736_16470, partial [Firmicutes bacterium]|nr:hypothetical protein [Bacillota bacterium]
MMKKGESMRKHIKKQLLELLATVKDGIRYVVSITDNNEQAENVLIDCYSAFTHINETLSGVLKSERYSEYEEVISEIQADMEIFNECIQDSIDYSEIYGVLNTNMNVFEDMLTDEKIRLEVVFLPYKASMWDSLESVWKAADEDENCDAYVIPIPYYDRNNDFTFGQMHYEGDLYPEYVHITDYNDYNFEARHPDKIYIHNPYDDGNLVTSIHPFFYTNNIKKYTDELIYIPYFVLGEINPNDSNTLKNIEHFVITSGVVNADKVIVESEDMRQAYINVLVNYFGKEEYRPVFEKKILGTGSPKYDKVLNTKKEDLEIPKEWLKIIEKPDGTWKKIFFYNTGLTALLQHSEKMLDKIEDVFKVFYENREEVALLWRPHPLIKATIASMRPQLWEKYKRIADKYIKDGWGIYDDS